MTAQQIIQPLRGEPKQRLIKRIGAISSEKLNEVNRAIQISLGLIDL
jgi:mRNA-degrading endonuclease toxin of MazEF toxin-antitoxin module